MQKTEFVPLGSAQHGEGFVAALADIGAAGAESKQTVQFSDGIGRSKVYMASELAGLGGGPA
jgi:hypothetical protein